MPSIRFTFQAEDRDVEALLGRIQSALRAVRAEEEGAANEFTAITAGARAALAIAQQQVQVARAQVAQVRERGAAEVAAARVARDSAIETARVNRETSLQAIQLARQRSLETRGAARDELNAARAVQVARSQSVSNAEAEERVIRRIAAEQVQTARTAALQSRRRLEDAQSTLNDLRLTQRGRVLQGSISPDELDISKQRIQDQKELVELLRLEAQEQGRALAAAKATAAEAKTGARARVDAARQELQAARTLVKSKQDELRAAKEAGAAAVAAAEKAAAAEVRAGRASVAAAQQRVTAARTAALAQNQQATAALATARATQTNAQAALGAARAQQQLARAQNQAANAGRTHADVLGRLTSRLATLFAAVQGAQLFARFVNEGLKFNQVIETATLAIASLVDAESDISVGGRPVRDMEKLGVAVQLTTAQVQKLRIAGLQTAATTEQLVDAFQQAVGAGLAAGLTLDQIRKTTIQIVQAANALGVPLNQLNQEVRSILDATIDRNSRVARVLGITNAQVRLMKEEGRLAEFLNQKLLAFTQAGEVAQHTFQVIKSNMVEALQVLSGDATKPLFDSLKQGFEGALNQLFDFKAARVSEQFQGLIQGLQGIFGRIGQLLADAIADAVAGAKSLGDWFRDNREEVEAVLAAVDQVTRAIFQTIAAAAQLGVELIRWGVLSGTTVAVFRTIRDVLKGAIDIVHSLTNGWVATGAAIVTVIALVVRLGGAMKALEAIQAVLVATNPFLLAAAAVGALLFAVNFVIARNERLEAQQKAIREEFEKTASAVGSLAVEYAKLAEQINRGELKDDDLIDAEDRLVDMGNKLIAADQRYMQVLGDKTKALQENSRRTKELREEHQALLLEEDKLNAAIKGGTLSRKERAAAQARVAEIERQLNGIERENARLALEEKGKFHDLLLGLKQVADARVEDAKAMFIQAQAALVMLRAQAEEAKQRRLNQRARQARTTEGERLADQKEADAFAQGIHRVEQEVSSLSIRLNAAQTKAKELEKVLAAPPITITGRERPSDLNSKARAENDAKQFAQAQLKQIEAGLDLAEETLKDRFAQHRVSIQQYYKGLELLQTIAIEDEIKVHQQLLSKLTDPGDRAKELAEIAALKQKELELAHTTNIAILKDTKELDAQVSKARVDLLEAQGRESEAQIERLRAQFSDLRAALAAEVKAGTPGAQASLDVVDQLLNTEIFKVRITAIRNLIAQFKTDVGEEVSEISDRVQAGDISQKQGAEETIAAYQRVIAQLEAVRDQYDILNLVTGDPAAAKAVQLLTAAINGLKGPLRAAIDASEQLRNALFGAFQQSLVEAFTTGIDEAQNFSDVMRSVAISVVNSLRQIIAQIIAFKIVSAAFNLVGAGTPAGAAPPGARAGGLITPIGPTMPAYGMGGRVRGAGTSTSDSIAARLSHGEYVIRAKKVRELGVDFFDEINFGRRGAIPRGRRRAYAEGGLVGAEERQTSKGGTARLDATIGLEDGLVVRQLRSDAGARAVMELLRRNRKAARSTLGVG